MGGGRTYRKQNKGSTSITVAADVWNPEPLNDSYHLFIIRQRSGNPQRGPQTAQSTCERQVTIQPVPQACQVAGRVAQQGGGAAKVRQGSPQAPTFPTSF